MAEAQQQNVEAQVAETEQDRKRPAWLEDIASKSQRTEEPQEDTAAQKPVGPGGRVWDERWGYMKPNFDRVYSGKGKGKGKGGHFAGGKGGGFAQTQTGPPKRGYKLQRCPKWGQNLKCKKGWHCPFAHGDHELAPKEVRSPPTFAPCTPGALAPRPYVVRVCVWRAGPSACAQGGAGAGGAKGGGEGLVQ